MEFSYFMRELRNTSRYCKPSLNENFVVPHPPNTKQNKQKKPLEMAPLRLRMGIRDRNIFRNRINSWFKAIMKFLCYKTIFLNPSFQTDDRLFFKIRNCMP